MEKLRQLLRRIDGRGYPAYKDIKGTYCFNDFDLDVVHVQGDPFAGPSQIAIRIDVTNLGISQKDIENVSRRTGLEDSILRQFVSAVRKFRKPRGSGKSGEWGILIPGQEILARTACEVDSNELTLRFTVGLPARGRRILGREAADLLIYDLPDMVRSGVFEVDKNQWAKHADASEDQEHLRGLLKNRHWIAFIANESCLPRVSGVDDRPLKERAQLWVSPKEIEAEVELPNAGKLKGAAISEGVTLICGGGYHGKSTLLQAISRGIYNHIPGDGREYCVSLYDAVMVRAEDGRRVCDVNISAFISNLPNEGNTVQFLSDNASGSTSQAANIIEALELGAKCLLIDEDTSATNFMVRDRRMQELVVTDKEPITPFVDRVREMFEAFGVSTILVVGGAGDYFDVADHVLLMDTYIPRMETERAKAIAKEFPSKRLEEKRPELVLCSDRIPQPQGFDPSRGRRSERMRTSKTRSITIGVHEIDVSLVGQIVDDGQARTIGDWIIRCSRNLADGKRTLREICESLEKEAIQKGLSETTLERAGDRVFTRRFELAAAINRLRTLQIRS